MTDTFQSLVLILSILTVMILGYYKEGGYDAIIEASSKTGRLEMFNMTPSPVVRHSFWSVLIGGTFYWLAMYCANQASIQKYLSVDSLASAQKAVWAASVGAVLVFLINFNTGLVLFKHYEHCDPLKSHDVHGMDEILPLYIMNTLSQIRGIPGFFVSGIFAASLGIFRLPTFRSNPDAILREAIIHRTVAAAISSLAAVSIKDVCGSLFNINIPDEKGATISKWLSLFFGLLSFGLVFVVEQLGGVLQVALSFNGITGGVVLGLFSLGMFFPWANAKGAMVGGISGLLVVSWIGFGAQAYVLSGGELYDDEKPVDTQGCRCLNGTISAPLSVSPLREEAFWVYRISYMWYSVIGWLLTIAVGLFVSWATGFEKPSNVDPDFISPPINYILSNLPNEWKLKLDVMVESKDPVPVTTISKGSAGGHVNLALNLDSENLPPAQN